MKKKNWLLAVLTLMSMQITANGEVNKDLIEAVRKKDYLAVKDLLENYDADPNATIRNETPLSVAFVQAKYPFLAIDEQILNLLVEYGADVNDKVRFAPLIIYVALLDNPAGVKFLINNGADVLVTDALGQTAFEYVQYQPDPRGKRMAYDLKNAQDELEKIELAESFEELSAKGERKPKPSKPLEELE